MFGSHTNGFCVVCLSLSQFSDPLLLPDVCHQYIVCANFLASDNGNNKTNFNDKSLMQNNENDDHQAMCPKNVPRIRLRVVP